MHQEEWEEGASPSAEGPGKPLSSCRAGRTGARVGCEGWQGRAAGTLHVEH